MSALRDRIARVIFDEGWTFDGEHGTGAHARHMADLVIADLGLVEGVAFAPEGLENAVGVLLSEPPATKFQAGQPVFVVAGRSAR